MITIGIGFWILIIWAIIYVLKKNTKYGYYPYYTPQYSQKAIMEEMFKIDLVRIFQIFYGGVILCSIGLFAIGLFFSIFANDYSSLLVGVIQIFIGLIFILFILKDYKELMKFLSKQKSWEIH